MTDRRRKLLLGSASSETPAKRFFDHLDGSSRVSGVVPAIYPRYLRIFNPVEASCGKGGTWREIARRAEVPLTSGTRWDDIEHAADGQPRIGEPDPLVALRLGSVLLNKQDARAHDWYFATWSGYMEGDSRTQYWAPSQNNSLHMLVFERLAEQFEEGQFEVPQTPLIPMFWWPDDLAWSVGQALYGRSVYLGCSEFIADSVLNEAVLETLEVSPDDAIEYE